MKWTHASGLVATFAMIAAGGVWASGCSDNNGGNDGGTDSGGNDVQQQDTGGGDSAKPDSGGDGGGGGVDASVLDCNYYCDNIATACTGNTNNQYKDKATCMSMCASIPNDAGAGATSGNSLACHMYHLSVAAAGGTTADTHCPHAGPYGYGMCGTLCEDFCSQYFQSLCKGDTAAYATIDACHAACGAQAGADAAAGAPGNPATSPTMLCKEYHLENAIQNGGDGGGHCDHAGAVSGICP